MFGGGGRNYYTRRDQVRSPWESGRGPQNQLAAASALLNAVAALQGSGQSSYPPQRDSFMGDRRPSFGRNPNYQGYKRPSPYPKFRPRTDDRPKSKFGFRSKDKDDKDAKSKDAAGKADENGDPEKKSDEKDDEMDKRPWEYRCHLCRVKSNNPEEHLEHLKTEEHKASITEQRARYKRQTRAIVSKLRNIEDQEMPNSDPRNDNFCVICNVGFLGPPSRHNMSRLHKDMRNLKSAFCRQCNMRFSDRIYFDEHLLSLAHMKKRSKLAEEGEDAVLSDDGDSDEEDLKHPEEFDGKTPVGAYCVNKVVGYYCKICRSFFTQSDLTKAEHCITKEHFNKFVEHAKVRKEEIEKEKLIEKNVDEKQDANETVDEEMDAVEAEVEEADAEEPEVEEADAEEPEVEEAHVEEPEDISPKKSSSRGRGRGRRGSRK